MTGILKTYLPLFYLVAIAPVAGNAECVSEWSPNNYVDPSKGIVSIITNDIGKKNILSAPPIIRDGFIRNGDTYRRKGVEFYVHPHIYETALESGLIEYGNYDAPYFYVYQKLDRNYDPSDLGRALAQKIGVNVKVGNELSRSGYVGFGIGKYEKIVYEDAYFNFRVVAFAPRGSDAESKHSSIIRYSFLRADKYIKKYINCIRNEKAYKEKAKELKL